MAALEVLALNEATSQIRAPGVGDTYTMPRALAVTGGNVTLPQTASTSASLQVTGGGGNSGFGSANGYDWYYTRAGSGMAFFGFNRFCLGSGNLTWASTVGGTADTILTRDAANTLAQRNGTNAQTLRLYGTYTDASNYTRLAVNTTSTTVTIQTEKAGTGGFGSLVLGSNAGGNITMGANVALAANTISIAGRPVVFPGNNLTIATGAVTVTHGFHFIDTEASAATDDLDTINGGQTGQTLVIKAVNSARTVVAKDGTGNLRLAGDFSMDNADDTLSLIHDGTNWLETSRSDNGA